MDTIRLGRVEDFPANTCRLVPLPSGEPVAVINVDGDIHVLEGRCAQGHSFEHITVIASEGRVLCPWHGWELDLKRGVCLSNPNCLLKVFAVRLDRDEVVIAC